MFEVGFIDVAGFVPLRADVFLAGALFPALVDGGAFGTGAAFDVLFTPAEVPAGTVFVAALLAGDLLVPGLAAALLRVPARLATWRAAACGGRWYVTRSRGPWGLGSLYVGTLGRFRRYRWALPIWGGGHQRLDVGEHAVVGVGVGVAGPAMVYSVRRSRLE